MPDLIQFKENKKPNEIKFYNIYRDITSDKTSFEYNVFCLCSFCHCSDAAHLAEFDVLLAHKMHFKVKG